MELKEASNKAEQSSAPTACTAGVYVYRDSVAGKALKKRLDRRQVHRRVWPDVFFYADATPGRHTLSTESEFSPSDSALMLDAGKNYFYRQFIKAGW